MPKFVAGRSGNPSGRRAGSRNTASILCDKLAADEAGDVLRGVIVRAKAGDAQCASLILQRVWPARRARVRFAMPTMATAADLPRAIAAILERIAAGDLSPDEGAAVCSVVEAMHRALELTAIDSRLRAVEERTKG